MIQTPIDEDFLEVWENRRNPVFALEMIQTPRYLFSTGNSGSKSQSSIRPGDDSDRVAIGHWSCGWIGTSQSSIRPGDDSDIQLPFSDPKPVALSQSSIRPGDDSDQTLTGVLL